MPDMSPSAYTPDLSLKAKVLRRLTQWRNAKPLEHDPVRPIVTITFDDFPKSAATTGASIIEAAGGHATYYACTGLAGEETITGPQYDAGDVARLLAAGHEIGGHTESHLDCSNADVDAAVEDIRANLLNLKTVGLTKPVTQFAYPYGETRVALKFALRDTFKACRGVLRGINSKGSDLMQLRAMELDANPANLEKAIAAIESAARKPAWVIIFTHDVRETPSPFGVTPHELRRVVNAARDNGAALLSMSEALAEIEGTPA